MSAALIGSGVGLSLGAIYLVGDRAVPETAVAPTATRALVGQDRFASGLAGAGAQAAGQEPDPARLAQTAPSRARELDCLAQAVYFEARGESVRGQAAVATVIINRVRKPGFPKTVCGVVYQGAAHHGCQFSFACDGNAERVVEWNAWERARGVAARVLSGAVLRDIGSATHFHAAGVDPEWGSRMLRVAQVGLHVFYRLNPHAPPPAADDAGDPPRLASRALPTPTPLRLAAVMSLPAGEPVGAATDAAPPAPEPQPAVKAVEPPAPPAKAELAPQPKPKAADTGTAS